MSLTITDFWNDDHGQTGGLSKAKINTGKDMPAKSNEQADKANPALSNRDTVAISAEANARNAKDPVETPDDSSEKANGTMYGGNMKILQEKNAPADTTNPDDIQKQIDDIKQKIQEAEQKLKSTATPTATSAEDGAEETLEAQSAQQELSQYQTMLSQLQMQLLQVSQKAST